MRIFFFVKLILFVNHLSFADDLVPIESIESFIEKCEDPEFLKKKFSMVKRYSDNQNLPTLKRIFISKLEGRCQNFSIELGQKLSHLIDKEIQLEIDQKFISLTKDLIEGKNLDKCNLYYTKITELNNIKKKYSKKIPKELDTNLINNLFSKDNKKIKQNINECFLEFIKNFECAGLLKDSALDTYEYYDNEFKGSVLNVIFDEMSKSCSHPQEKVMISEFKKFIKPLILESKKYQYNWLIKVLEEGLGRIDHRPIYNKMLEIAKELDDSYLIEQTLRMPQKYAFPHIDKILEYQRNRKKSCTDKDNFNWFIRNDQDQSKTSSCFAFGAANLLNYHLGLRGISPLYLFTLSIAKNSAFWYPAERALQMLPMNLNSISSYNGGFSKNVIEEALKRDTYCSINDLIDFNKNSIPIENLILKIEANGKEIQKLYRQLKEKKISDNEFQDESLILYAEVFNFFPNSTINEYLMAAKTTKNHTEFFTKFIFSQCKTPLPKESKLIEVNHEFNFTNLIPINIEKIDNIINSGNIGALGIQAHGVFSVDLIDEWSPHIVTLTGRRWSEENTRCEYRIINSWGATCTDVANPDVYCNESEGELWISESLILTHGNSLTTIDKSQMLESIKDQNYEDFDPDF